MTDTTTTDTTAQFGGWWTVAIATWVVAGTLVGWSIGIQGIDLLAAGLFGGLAGQLVFGASLRYFTEPESHEC